MTSGMAMTSTQAEITELRRSGSHGWQFVAVWRMGTPGEVRRSYRTSGSTRGLQQESKLLPGEWSAVVGIGKQELWSRNARIFKQQMTQLFRSRPHYDPNH